MSLFRKNKPTPSEKNTSETVVEYLQALFGAIVLAILIRGFVFEPFKIPSESMMPTLLVGDHIFVKRFAYGLRVPFTKKWLAEFDDPKRGDVVVFSFPQDESVDFIKRVVGVPGDKIVLKDGALFVNDKEVESHDITLDGINPENRCRMQLDENSNKLLPEGFSPYPYYRMIQNFQPKIETFENGQTHFTQRSKVAPRETAGEWEVRSDEFFVMGDNRDHSEDSRFWGFVPRENLKGKAEFIWLSLNYEGVKCPTDFLFFKIRWDRFGREII